jgi:hypothetical protein
MTRYTPPGAQQPSGRGASHRPRWVRVGVVVLIVGVVSLVLVDLFAALLS